MMYFLDKKTVRFPFSIQQRHTNTPFFLCSSIVQQCFVIRNMIRDLHFPTRMHICPTVRDENGLALSSRNAYLTPSQKKYALVLYQSLRHMESLYRSGTINAAALIDAGSQLIEKARQEVEALGEDWKIQLDYVSINSAKDLEEIKGDIPKQDGCVISMAVFVGKTRLIDNLCLDIELST